MRSSASLNIYRGLFLVLLIDSTGSEEGTMTLMKGGGGGEGNGEGEEEEGEDEDMSKIK